MNKYRKIKINFIERQELLISNYKVLVSNFAATINDICQNRFIECELALPLHASSYALLGMEFTVNKEADLDIEVRYNESKEEYKQTLSMTRGITYKGLPIEYANAVCKSISEYFKNCEEIPCGKLIVKVAAHCEVGSSQVIFECLTKIMLDIMFREYDNITEEQVEDICDKRLKQRFINKKL